MKSIYDFNFEHQPGTKRDTIARPATVTYLQAAFNIVLLGPPGTDKTHFAIDLGAKELKQEHRLLLPSTTDWVTRLANAHHAG